MGDQGAPYYHTLVEVAKAVHASLDGRLADPNFVALPLESMLTPGYIEQQRALILPDHARREADYAAGIQPLEMACPSSMPANATAYVATVDESGLAVSLIQSLHSPFGSGVIAGDTGVLLHNSGAAFSLQAHSPNRLEPHKRPAQPLIPAMAFDGERPWMIFGASGGEGEPQIHAALVTRVADMGYNIQQAIEAPRWLCRPPEGDGMGTLYIEGRVPDSVLRQLREMGHEVKVVGDWSDMMGQAQGIIIDAESRVFRGGADPRGDGQAIGW
jgi:gamma-glutamyltranspeptidase/glutathione hydrolase